MEVLGCCCRWVVEIGGFLVSFFRTHTHTHNSGSDVKTLTILSFLSTLSAISWTKIIHQTTNDGHIFATAL